MELSCFDLVSEIVLYYKGGSEIKSSSTYELNDKQNFKYICEQWQPRSECMFTQSDHGIHLSLTKSWDTVQQLASIKNLY